MNRITLKNNFRQAKDILVSVLSNSPTRPISIEEMRSRVSMVDRLSSSDDNYIDVSPTDHAIVKEALHHFPWSSASRIILDLVDDVENAAQLAELHVVDETAASAAE
jgi:hypothetical protein